MPSRRNAAAKISSYSGNAYAALMALNSSGLNGLVEVIIIMRISGRRARRRLNVKVIIRAAAANRNKCRRGNKIGSAMNGVMNA